MNTLILLETFEEIQNAQRMLEAALYKSLGKTIEKNIGFPGGVNRGANVSTDGNYWYWSGDYTEGDSPNPRRLNWFGVFDADNDLQITVEINVPYEGNNTAIAGFFAKDAETGNIYLLHSGRVGGGKKGVGKFAFLAWSYYKLHTVFDSTGNSRTGIIVMPIFGKSARNPIFRYVNTIADFKIAVRKGDLDSIDFNEKKKTLEDFYSESSGHRKGNRSSTIDYVSRHGEVVDALFKWRQETIDDRQNTKIVKNVFIDLGVAKNGQLNEVYEVKTSIDRQVIYSAIGQLITHGIEDDCKRFIVLPTNGEIASDLLRAFNKMNISLIRFTIDTDSVQIENI